MLEELIKDLKRHDRAEIAYKSGVSFTTVNKIMSGENKNPTLATITALRVFLDDKEKEVEK